MDDFWFNHFNVFAGKGEDRWYLTSYERDVIQPHALGKFKDLVDGHGEKPGDAVLSGQLFERRSAGGAAAGGRARHAASSARYGRFGRPLPAASAARQQKKQTNAA